MNPVLILARFFLSFIILWFPLLGGALAIYLDGTDWHSNNFLGFVPFGEYQLIDKSLDMLYLSFLLVIALYLKNKVVRYLLLGLFLFRLVGFILFGVTGTQSLLFFFPNIFENYFFFYYILRIVAGYEPKMSYVMIALTLFLVAIPKILQEYVMHIIQKPLMLEFWGIKYQYELINHQILFILGIAVLFGFLYRAKKKH